MTDNDGRPQPDGGFPRSNPGSRTAETGIDPAADGVDSGSLGIPDRSGASDLSDHGGTAESDLKNDVEPENTGATISDKPVDLDVGVTYTRTAALSGTVVRDAASTATALWKQLVDPWSGAGLAEEIVAAVRDLTRGDTPAEARAALEEAVGERALDGALVDVFASLAGDVEDRWFWKAVVLLPQLGSGRPMGFRSDLEDCRAALGPLVATGRTPTVSIRLPGDFREVDAETRQSWCELVAALGRACDVRLVCSGVERAWLAEHHRDDLPGVSERGSSGTQRGDLAAALDVVSVGSRHARILRLLAADDTETLAYSRLYSEFSVGSSRVRQVVGELVDVGLVETFGPSQKRRVELTSAGRQFFTEEIAVQRRLGERVSESGNLSNESRVTPRAHGEGEDRPETAPPATADRHRLPAHHETRYCSRRTAAAALGTAVEGGISVVDYPVAPQNDRAEGRWHYENDRLVVTCEGDNPLQVWTTLALALADRRTWDRVLTEDRLDEHGVLGMLRDAKEVLRGMRNIGHLPDTVETYDELREAMLDWANGLEHLTSKYHDSDDDTLRSPITKDALGLAGSLTHLLDLVDVDVDRVVKFPEFSRRFSEGRAGAVFESLAIGSAIGSGYGHHVAYRHLFEGRADKRQQAFTPTVDAADPWARIVGSWTLVGDFAGKTDDVADAVSEEFEALDPHDNAPEMAIRTTVRTEPTRRQVAETARRMLESKDLRLTPEATSVLHGLARTAWDVADALQYLAGDNDGRRVDAAEVRYALSQLEYGRLLRGFDGRRTTPRRLVAALLEAGGAVTAAELDERADVSSRSRREHLADLVEVGLVRETDEGRYRFRLSIRDVEDTEAGRYTNHWPTYVADPELSNDAHAAAKTLRVGRDHHGPGDPVDAPGWPYTGFTEPPDLRELSAPWPYLDHVLPALWAIRECDQYRDDVKVAPSVSVSHVTSGPPIEQTSLEAGAEQKVAG